MLDPRPLWLHAALRRGWRVCGAFIYGACTFGGTALLFPLSGISLVWGAVCLVLFFLFVAHCYLHLPLLPCLSPSTYPSSTRSYQAFATSLIFSYRQSDLRTDQDRVSRPTPPFHNRIQIHAPSWRRLLCLALHQRTPGHFLHMACQSRRAIHHLSFLIASQLNVPLHPPLSRASPARGLSAQCLLPCLQRASEPSSTQSPPRQPTHHAWTTSGTTLPSCSSGRRLPRRSHRPQ